MNEEIDFDEVDNIEFDTLADQDRKHNFLNKTKRVLKGTPEEKTVKKVLNFTQAEKEDIEKYQQTLGATTFNGIIYKLIELGKQQHKKDLKKLLKK